MCALQLYNAVIFQAEFQIGNDKNLEQNDRIVLMYPKIFEV